MQKIGVLGGMFDPIHQGHIHAARCALDFGLSRVLLLPCGHPVHRDNAQADGHHRFEMCALAAKDEPRILPCDADLRSGPCYAADTLRILKTQYPSAVFYWIIGADKLPSLHHWKDADYLFKNCEFLICPRPGYDAHISVPGAKTHVLNAGSIPSSSGEIIRRLRLYDDAPEDLSPAVSRYIAENGLYQQDFIPALLSYGMQESRLRHTLGVRQEAVHLAQLHGARMQAAAVAAMLHDIAKPLPLSEMQRLAAQYALDLPEDILSDGNLLHGPVAAAIAEKELGVDDPEILSAISAHTTGKENMTVLEMCVFLADAIEPTRRDYPGLAEMRRLSQSDLAGAVLLSMQRTQEYVLSRGLHFCTRTEKAMQDLIIRRLNYE